MTTTKKTAHTPGELHVGAGANPKNKTLYISLPEGDNAKIATVHHESFGAECEEFIAGANAERLSSCWNACSGMENPQEAIEALKTELKEARVFVAVAKCQLSDEGGEQKELGVKWTSMRAWAEQVQSAIQAALKAAGVIL